MRPAGIRKIGRKRGVVGWPLLTLGAVLAAGWCASAWYLAAGGPWPAGWRVERGEIILFPTPGKPVREWLLGDWMVIEPEDWQPRMCWRVDLAEWSGWNVHDYWLYGTVDGGGLPGTEKIDVRVIAAWPIPVLLILPGLLLIRSGMLARRRAIEGRCAKCGYLVSGLAMGAPCPECGKVTTSA